MKLGVYLLFLSLLFSATALGSSPQRLDGAFGESVVGFVDNTQRFVYSELTGKVIYLAENDNSVAFNQLYSVNLNGGEAIEYTDPLGQTIVNDFQLSPDEKTIVYRTIDLQQGGAQLWSVPTSGGTPTRLDSPSQRALEFFIDPTSSRVVYGDFDSYYSVPLNGGDIIDLVDLPFPGSVNQVLPNITPDGATLTFSARRSMDEEIRPFVVTVPIQGGVNEVLREVGFSESYNGSRLNDRVLFIGYRDISTIPIGGGEPTTIDAGLSEGEAIDFLNSSVSPNMQSIAYVTNTSFGSAQQLNAVSLTGGNSIELNSVVTGLKLNCGLFFAPNSNKLVWCEKLGFNGDSFYSYVDLASPSDVINLNNGNPIAGTPENIEFDTSGTRIFVSSLDSSTLDGDDDYSMVSLPLNGDPGQSIYTFDSDADLIDFCTYDPIFNSDHSEFLSCRAGNPDFGLFMQNSDGSALEGVDTFKDPDVSILNFDLVDNGEKIIFLIQDRNDGNASSLYVTDARVINDDEICFPVKSKTEAVSVICL